MKTSLQLRMQHQPDSLTLLLHGLTEEQIRSRPIRDKWSIYENIVHLARYHEIFKDRIEQIQFHGSTSFLYHCKTCTANKQFKNLRNVLA